MVTASRHHRWREENGVVWFRSGDEDLRAGRSCELVLLSSRRNGR
jgi:hypothetical protein